MRAAASPPAARLAAPPRRGAAAAAAPPPARRWRAQLRRLPGPARAAAEDSGSSGGGSGGSGGSSSCCCSSGGSGAGRRALLLGAAAAAAAAAAPQPAHAGLLDLPACADFRPAGPLQLCEVRVGTGDPPAAGDLIEVDYTARAAATGKVYDGSRGFKFTVGNGEVIPGWELGILGDGSAALPPVRAGGTRTLLVPPDLAFGARGDNCLFGRAQSCRVPPGSAVVITFRFVGLGY
ncbi:FKBP13 [Scenedesmus sp. PABB004]|nr:FKBP13 [Scenedesmus sp. PABB004]